MLYRKLGKTNEKVSVLGLGTRHLPTKGSNTHIDTEKSEELLSYGIENGINIIDTGYSYHSTNYEKSGNSEIFLGNFLDENYSEEVLLSTKSPTWLINDKSDFDKYLDEQLKKLKTDQIDIYMLHALTENNWEKLKELDVFEFMDSALESGKIKHIGFSAHTEYDYIVEYIQDYPKFEVGLTQLNYVDEQYKSGIEGIKQIANEGLGTIITEPLRRGTLINNVPKNIMDIFETSEVKRTPLQWALEYLWNQKIVNCVICGVDNKEQLKENIEIASKDNLNKISENDAYIIKEAAREYRYMRSNDCSGCGFCYPCPHGVNIPGVFREFNEGTMLNDPKASNMHYQYLLKDEEKADKCIDCGECIPICHQMINIPEELKKAAEFFK